MKINMLLSAIKAFSAWLHGEGGRHFRTYTYPRIKAFTRKFFTLGIYEKVEGFYRVVDDTFYQGELPTEPQDPAEVARIERLAEQVESGQVDLATDTASAVPQFKNIRNKLILWKGLEQGNTYKCGTYTMNNMLRTAMLMLGMRPPLEVTAIDPLYIETKAGKGKEGTVMADAFAWLQRNGYPMPSWTPLMVDHNKELDALESSKTIRNARLFPGIKATGRVKTAHAYETARQLDLELPKNWLMQVSVNFSPSLKYFGQLVPFVEKVNGRYQLTRTGGHSVHGVRGSFSTWEDGEPGFAIIESAYRSREDGWRFLKAKLFSYNVLTVRFVELDIPALASQTGDTALPAPTPAPTPAMTSDDSILVNQDISYGQAGEPVKALQRFLASAGYPTASGVTGNFLSQTRDALRAWQNANLKPGNYTGEYWAALSREKYRTLRGI